MSEKMKIQKPSLKPPLRILAVVACALLASACLRTRSEVAEQDQQKVIQSQVSLLQKNKADQEANLQGYESQIRSLNGRLEILEHQTAQLTADRDDLTKKLTENDERFKQLEQALLQVEQGQVMAARPAREDDSRSRGGERVSKKAYFQDAEEYFAKKQYKKAVVLYQKYRDKSPNGADVAEATLKIGLCFQEMKMIKEARVFFDEVVEKHHKSKYAKIAQARLAQLKKK
jgi:TolA-binding protein